jgi:hypothetical protein
MVVEGLRDSWAGFESTISCSQQRIAYPGRENLFGISKPCERHAVQQHLGGGGEHDDSLSGDFQGLIGRPATLGEPQASPSAAICPHLNDPKVECCYIQSVAPSHSGTVWRQWSAPQSCSLANHTRPAPVFGRLSTDFMVRQTD